MGRVAEAAEGESKRSAPNPWKKKFEELEGQVASKDAKMRQAAKAVGPHLLDGAIIVGSAGAAGAVKGYFGDKLKVGGVDLRVGAAVLAAGVGVQQIGAGKKMGTHLLAFAEGVAASVASDVGQDWGRRMADKRAAGGSTSTAPAEVNPDGKRLKRDASGQPVRDASGQPVYEGEIRRIELSSPPAPASRTDRARERLPRSAAR